MHERHLCDEFNSGVYRFSNIPSTLHGRDLALNFALWGSTNVDVKVLCNWSGVQGYPTGR